MGMGAIWTKLRGGNIPTGDKSAIKDTDAKAKKNTNLLSGKEGDNVSLSTDNSLEALYNKRETLEKELDAKSNELKNSEGDKSKAIESAMEAIKKELEKTKAEIAQKEAIASGSGNKTEETTTPEAIAPETTPAVPDKPIKDELDGLTDKEKLEKLEEKQKEIETKMAEYQALKAEINNLASQPQSLDGRKKLTDLVAQLNSIGGDPKAWSEELTQIREEIASLQGKIEDSMTPQEKQKAEVDEKIKQMEEQYQKLLEERRSLANGTIVYERGPMGIMRPTIKYSDDPAENAKIKEQILALDLQMRLVQSDIARLKAEAAFSNFVNGENSTQDTSFWSINNENSNVKSLSEEELEALKQKHEEELKALEELKNAENNVMKDDPLWAIGNGNNSVNSTNQLSEEALKKLLEADKNNFHTYGYQG